MPAKNTSVTILYDDKPLRGAICFGFIPFNGYSLMAAYLGKRLCSLQLCEPESEDCVLERLTRRLPDACLLESADAPDSIAEALEALLDNQPVHLPPLHVCGTPFQHKVWEALVRIPYGELRTYKELAGCIGHPKAARAVGTAAGANLIGVMIPCHRLVGANGMGGFAWGLDAKRYLISREQSVPDFCVGQQTLPAALP